MRSSDCQKQGRRVRAHACTPGCRRQGATHHVRLHGLVGEGDVRAAWVAARQGVAALQRAAHARGQPEAACHAHERRRGLLVHSLQVRCVEACAGRAAKQRRRVRSGQRRVAQPRQDDRVDAMGLRVALHHQADPALEVEAEVAGAHDNTAVMRGQAPRVRQRRAAARLRARDAPVAVADGAADQGAGACGRCARVRGRCG